MAFPQRLINLFDKSGTVSRSALRFSTYAEDYRVRGYQFIHLYNDTIPTGTTYFLLDPTAAVSTHINVFTFPVEIDIPEGPLSVALYEGGNYTGGSLLPYYNPERNSSITPVSVLTGGATGTDEGDLLYSFNIGSASSSAVATTSGVGSTTDPTVLDKTKKYMVKVVNATGSAITANKIYFPWFEVPTSEL